MKDSNQLIPSEAFVRRMEQHWTQNLGNVPSEPLRQTWKQLADAFNLNINSHNSPEFSNTWIVVQPATGTGKTQGAIVYCSLLDLSNHPGALIVTRLINDANMIAAQINELSGREVAIAHHSESDSKLVDLKDWPVLVITHRAYEMALDFLGQDGTIQQTWPFFHEWDGQRRKLVIIDECLDLVDHSRVDLDSLRQTLAAIPQTVRNQFPAQIDLITGVVEILEQVNEKMSGKSTPERMIDISGSSQLSPTDLTPLRAALRGIRFDWQNKKNDLYENERLRKVHDEVLRSLNYMFRSWLYYTKIDARHTFNTARLLVPEEVKGAVVLDATASANVVYQLFDHALLWTPPPGARDYQNVTLHVSNGHRLGKVFMSCNSQKLSEELIAQLNDTLAGRDVFLITHKAVEPRVMSYETSFKLNTGHWGKVDGSNQWKDCDTCVVFGLPFRPDWWTASLFMAYRGPQETEWLRADTRPFNGYMDIRQALKRGQIITDVVQAINRVQCRKVIDAEGNCPPTDVYLMLPDPRYGELLSGIEAEMPGVKTVAWAMGQQQTTKRLKRSNIEAAAVKYFGGMLPGRESKSRMQRELGISLRSMDTLIKKMLDDDCELSRMILKLGVKVEVIREGKTQRTFFVKD